MTQHPQPKEYIITEATIKKILSGHPWDEDMLRSRPSHTPAATEQCKKCYDDGYSSGIRDAAATIRNQTLDDFLKEIKGDVDPALDYIDLDSIEAAYIRLRHQSTDSGVTDR